MLYSARHTDYIELLMEFEKKSKILKELNVRSSHFSPRYSVLFNNLNRVSWKTQIWEYNLQNECIVKLSYRLHSIVLHWCLVNNTPIISLIQDTVSAVNCFGTNSLNFWYWVKY